MWLLTGINKTLAGIGAFLAAVVLAFAYGRRRANDRRDVQDLEIHLDTKERIDEVQPSADRDAAIKRLRDNDIIR